MAMAQFIYCITNPGNEIFLKEEVAQCYNGVLAFSFSKPGVCTFKVLGKELALSQIRDLDFAYARAWGQTLGLVKKEEVLSKVEEYIDKQTFCTQLALDPNNRESFDFKLQLEQLGSVDWRSAEKFLIVVKVQPKLYLVGQQRKDEFNSPPGRIFYELEEKIAPSRAYHKIKESLLLFGLESKINNCVEFGCAPGGCSTYLLEQGLDVHGVDPANMHESVLSNSNFHFHQLPMQNLLRQDIPTKIDLLVSDVNLNPKLVLRTLRNLFGGKPPRMALITLKTSEPAMVEQKYTWRKILEEMSYSKIDFVQLSSHRNECLAYARFE